MTITNASRWSDPGRAGGVGGANGLLLVNGWWEPLTYVLRSAQR